MKTLFLWIFSILTLLAQLNIKAQYNGFLLTDNNKKIKYDKIKYQGENVIIKNSNGKQVLNWNDLKCRITNIGHTDHFMKDPDGIYPFISAEIVVPGEITCFLRKAFGDNGRTFINIYLSNDELGINRVYYSQLLKSAKKQEETLAIFKKYFETDQSIHSKISLKILNDYENIIRLVHEYNSNKHSESEECNKKGLSSFTIYRRKKGEMDKPLFLTLNDSLEFLLPIKSKIFTSVPANCISKICIENDQCYLINPSQHYNDNYKVKWEKTDNSKSFEWTDPYDAKNHLYGITNEIESNKR